MAQVLSAFRLQRALVASLMADGPATAVELAAWLDVGEGVTRWALIELCEAGRVSATPKGDGGWQAQVWSV